MRKKIREYLEEFYCTVGKGGVILLSCILISNIILSIFLFDIGNIRELLFGQYEYEEVETEAEVEIEAEVEVETEAETVAELSNIDYESSTEERIMAIMRYLVEEENFTVAAASAVCGNAAVESCYNSACFTEYYYGLFMWNYLEEGGYAWGEIANWLIANDYDTASFEGQVKALVYADHGQMTDKLWKEFITLENIDAAVELFTIFYEGCPGGVTLTEYYDVGQPYQGLETRKKEAWQAYYLYTGQQDTYNGEKPYVGNYY